MGEIKPLQTLAVDIGGSGIKVMVLDEQGNPLSERDRRETPQPATPDAMITTIVELAQDKVFDRVSVGYPGVVRLGITETAANVSPEWIGFDLGSTLTQYLGKPVRIINDADMQGLGAIAGQGVELVITLGTGFGSALFVNAKLLPNLELGHHPFRKGETYEQQLGKAALDAVGKKRWNQRLSQAIANLSHLFNYDKLYIGGGNTKKVEQELPANVIVVPNVTGLLGGIKLWQD
ncbi:MAG: ROK family protein [Leptolyngbyaceae cyanobacterium CRU_2_3]|nr:ROK family protein [Leptolyngbyaceae cyanobacterium CRU_2_3]